MQVGDIDLKNNYIYLIGHQYYDTLNLCKLGKTTNIPDRMQHYKTCLPTPIFINDVFRVIDCDLVEKQLQNYFIKYNADLGGGKEFYDKTIIDLVETYLKDNNVDYHKLTEEEIYNLVGKYRDRNYKEINIKEFVEVKEEVKEPTKRDYQIEVIKKVSDYYKDNNKCLLSWMCGLGKTLTSLWIVFELGMNTAIIGVPHIHLINQWEKTVNLIFPNIPCFIVRSGISDQNITEFINKNNKFIIITTYASCYKLSIYKFDFKILDEVHHLTGEISDNDNSENNDKDNKKTNKEYIKMLEISAKKQLSLTATPKILNTINKNKIIGNDNIEHFGNIIDEKSLLWAIEKKMLCDYMIQLILNLDNDKLKYMLKKYKISKKDEKLFIAAFATLKSISKGDTNYVLIFSNNTRHAKRIQSYIELILKENDEMKELVDNLYYSNFDGSMKKKTQKEILDKFNESKFGIISCVYCLGEGYDNCLIDGICIAENMTSDIRIVQSLARALRLNKNIPNKIAKFILPLIYDDNWREKDEFSKIIDIIKQLGEVDCNVQNKITILRNLEINNVQSNSNIDKANNKTNINNEKEEKKDVADTEFNEICSKLMKEIELRSIKRDSTKISYNMAKKIIKENNIKSKEEYFNNHIALNLPYEPDVTFQNNFINWIDYLGIFETEEYYELSECIEKVKEYLEKMPELKQYYSKLSIIVDKLRLIDSRFPQSGLWIEHYKVVSLKDIIVVNKKNNLPQ